MFVGDYTQLEIRGDPPHDNNDTHGFDHLVEWVQRHGRIREDAARLVVLTRTAGVSVEELASAQNVDPQTLRQRRLRAERRVRQNLALAL
jgi:predicted RNA polymerase sigma factor